MKRSAIALVVRVYHTVLASSQIPIVTLLVSCQYVIATDTRTIRNLAQVGVALVASIHGAVYAASFVAVIALLAQLVKGVPTNEAK